jgi:hypothetical protein
MSTKAENFHRNSTESSGMDEDYSYFITSDLPVEQIVNVLRLRGVSDKEIDSTVDMITQSRRRIHKVVNKFLGKINSTYPHLDIPQIIHKGMQHANKYGLTDAEKVVFKRRVLKGDIHDEYTYNNQIEYTPMAKFLGINYSQGHMIKVGPAEFSKLNELYALYESTKHIHANLKTNIANYTDCAPEAIIGKYDGTKHNVNISIHPVIAAIFLPKVEYMEKQMLYTNVARMVLSRAQAYLKDFNFHLHNNITPYEMNAELELAHNIATDPNALEHFSEDTPINNIIKRYRAQIELYMSVDNLRQGRYYSMGYDVNDGIAGLIKILNSYEWTFFDSPDSFAVQDEGTLLRKLLAIFSCRPTFTQLSSFTNRQGLGHTTITGMSKTVFVNIPIINIKLPIDLIGNQVHTIRLDLAMTQSDYVIEHKAFVPKNKSVVYSNSVAFFYANRRYPGINFNNTNMTMRYMSIPSTFINTTTINKTIISFKERCAIGRDLFDLRSVVILKSPPLNGLDIATGCSTLIVVDSDSPSSFYQNNGATAYLHYNPASAAIMRAEPNQQSGQTVFSSIPPVTHILEATQDPAEIGFTDEASRRGTIFFYTKVKI